MARLGGVLTLSQLFDLKLVFEPAILLQLEEIRVHDLLGLSLQLLKLLRGSQVASIRWFQVEVRRLFHERLVGVLESLVLQFDQKVVLLSEKRRLTLIIECFAELFESLLI